MTLKWFTYNCPHFKYLIKLDDDVFVDTERLSIYLDEEERQSFIACKADYDEKRLSDTKWKVLPSEYPYEFYPPYCKGYAIVYSGDVVSQLYEKAQAEVANFFWIDDIHVTGTLRQLIDVDLTPFNSTLHSIFVLTE